MSQYFFENIAPLTMAAKPRSAGLTMGIDWGIGLNAQHDAMDTGSEFLDLAKIAVGTGRLLPKSILSEKIALYQKHAVEPFPGGQFLEYAFMNKTEKHYLPEMAEAGYRWCEVSDNLAPVPLTWKKEMISRAVTDYGFQVLGEVGKKENLSGGVSLIKDAEACLEAGAAIILLEAAELFSNESETMREIDTIVERIGLSRVMFELPGPWIENVHACDIHKMRRQLLSTYGPTVNLGNVAMDEAVFSAALRYRLGVNAGGASEETSPH